MRVESRELLAGDYSDGRPKKGDRQRDNRPERASGRLLAAGVRSRAHTVLEDVSQLGRTRSGATGHVLLLFSQLQQEIAARVGLSRPQATNTIRGRFGVSRSIVRRVLELAKVA